VGGPTYDYGYDYLIFAYSGSVDITAEVVFAGYGLTVPAYDQAEYPLCTAPTIGYDDYAALDVTDKIVLVLRHGPNDDPYWYYVPCPNNIPGAAGSWAFGYKALNASLHGAKAMILVNDYNHNPEPTAGTLGASAYQPYFGAVRAHRSIGETLVTDLAARQASIDSTLTSASVPTGQSMRMVTNATYEPDASAENVLGAIPGTDPQIGDEVVIVSAHYDHERYLSRGRRRWIRNSCYYGNRQSNGQRQLCTQAYDSLCCVGRRGSRIARLRILCL
jgi:hypothetical protein